MMEVWRICLLSPSTVGEIDVIRLNMIYRIDDDDMSSNDPDLLPFRETPIGFLIIEDHKERREWRIKH
uniref:Uncharacterized protein n=1 Tax=Cannabis sativa TaxID=3483 RepID=A0A803QRF9_CANSA